jgi:hypothetical protein
MHHTDATSITLLALPRQDDQALEPGNHDVVVVIEQAPSMKKVPIMAGFLKNSSWIASRGERARGLRQNMPYNEHQRTQIATGNGRCAHRLVRQP